MPTYLEKNKNCITSSKLKEFLRCQRCYYCKYILEMPDPTEEGKDYFVIGQAFDDLMTQGKEKFDEIYEITKRRSDKAEKVQLTETMGELVKSMEEEFLANPNFSPNPKKKIIEIEFSGLKLRGELDDIDLKNKKIKDLKTCANVTTFKPDDYLHQMSFYQFLVEESTGEKCDALLEIVDKYTYFSRSIACLYRAETLESYRGQLLQGLEDLKTAHSLGEDGFLPASDQNVLYACPYYKDHGRPKEILIY